MSKFIERGTEEFEKISEFVQTDLFYIKSPIPYNQMIKSISFFEKHVGAKMTPPAKLSDVAKLQLRRAAASAARERENSKHFRQRLPPSGQFSSPETAFRQAAWS